MIKNKIKLLFTRKGLTLNSFAKHKSIHQSVFSRKLQTGKFTVEELSEIANYTDAKLCILEKENDNIIFEIENDDFIQIQKKKVQSNLLFLFFVFMFYY